nr:uncharacterized mitochondrial protein AtMg00810-like [Tanacetum cinerariifolium]
MAVVLHVGGCRDGSGGEASAAVGGCNGDDEEGDMGNKGGGDDIAVTVAAMATIVAAAANKDSSFELTAFSDANDAGCIDSRKSTSGGIQFLGDKLVSWMSKKQNCTVMSLVEAEYMALSMSCAQVMWMRTQLQDYGFNYNKIPLYYDSRSAIAISCNPVSSPSPLLPMSPSPPRHLVTTITPPVSPRHYRTIISSQPPPSSSPLRHQQPLTPHLRCH